MGTPDPAELLREMADRTETGYLFGGLSASRTANVQFAVGGNGNMAGRAQPVGVRRRFVRRGLWAAGAAAVARHAGLPVVGPLHTITAANDNVVLELDHEPALDVLLDTLQVTLDGDPNPPCAACAPPWPGWWMARSPGAPAHRPLWDRYAGAAHHWPGWCAARRGAG